MEPGRTPRCVTESGRRVLGRATLSLGSPGCPGLIRTETGSRLPLMLPCASARVSAQGRPPEEGGRQHGAEGGRKRLITAPPPTPREPNRPGPRPQLHTWLPVRP